MVRLLCLLAIAAAAGCASRPSPDSIASIEWQLTESGGFPPLLTEPPTATFDGRGQVFGKAWMNRYSAPCVLADDGTISVDAVSATKRAGPAAWMEEERRYFALLRNAKTWRARRDTLTLTTADRESLKFKKKPE